MKPSLYILDMLLNRMGQLNFGVLDQGHGGVQMLEEV